MKKIINFIIIILGFYKTANAQLIKIQGFVKDSILSSCIKSASVRLCKLDDKSFCYSGISGENGFFKIEHIIDGDFQLLISSQGYNTFSKKISINKHDTVLTVDNVYLNPSFVTLENIKIKAPQFYLNNDTLEYNADSYKLKEYATLQALLKKLPGVQIDNNGIIKVNGIAIKKLLVDNKTFFNDNMQLALNNLPAEIISKIQFYDEADDKTYSLKAGVKRKVKTINIKIKENKKTGHFGDASAGAGADSRYHYGLNLNRFNKLSQVSVIGQRSNIGIQSPDNVLDNNVFQNGEISSTAMAVDFKKPLTNSIMSFGSYSFKSVNNNSLNEILNQNFLGDSSIFTSQTGSTYMQNTSHNLSFNIEKKTIKSNLVVKPLVNFTNPQSQNSQELNQFSEIDTVYRSLAKNSMKGYLRNYAILGSYNYKFRKVGRILTLNFELKNTKDSLNEQDLNITRRPGNIKNTFNQMQLKVRKSIKTLGSLLYTTPLKKGIIELGYSYGFETYTNNNQVLKFNEADKAYNITDSFMANIYKIDIKTNKFKLDYNLTAAKFSIDAGAILENEMRLNLSSQKKFVLNQNNFNLSPTANLSYALNKENTIQFTYDGTATLPSFEEIQPFTSTSDSLFIFKGNVNLKSSFSHNFIFNYTKLIPSSASILSASAAFVSNINEIQSSITYLSNGIQELKFLNIKGNRGVTANINYSFPIKKLSSQVNFNFNVSHYRLPIIVNEQLQVMKNLYVESLISFSKQVTDAIDIECQSKSTLYGLNSTKRENSTFFTQYLSGKVNLYSKKGWVFSSIVDVNLFGKLSPSYHTTVPLLSSSLGKSFLKNKSCEIKLLVFDWFNRNLNISRININNTIQTMKTNSIGRNVLLLVSYKLRKFSK